MSDEENIMSPYDQMWGLKNAEQGIEGAIELIDETGLEDCGPIKKLLTQACCLLQNKIQVLSQLQR